MTALIGAVLPQSEYVKPTRTNILRDPKEYIGDINHKPAETDGQVQTDLEMAVGHKASDDRMAEALALLAEAMAVQVRQPQSQSKTLSERAAMWVPTLMTGALLVVGIVRWDTKREGDLTNNLGNVSAVVQQLRDDNKELRADLRDAREKADEAITWVQTTRELLQKQGQKTPPIFRK